MKLLIEQNLSFKLKNPLADLYPESEHVRGLSLETADDEEVWAHARDNGFACFRPARLKHTLGGIV